MAATGYSPIQLYYSTTASTAPTAGNLESGELAINITDGRLYYKDNAGAVQLLSTSTTANGTANGVLYLNGSKVATSGSALTFDGTTLGVTTGVSVGSGTSNTYIAGKIIQFYNTGAGDGLIKAADDTSSLVAIGVNKTELKFYSSGSEQMRLTSTGLGIGTSSPAEKLNIGSGGSIRLNRTDNSATGYVNLTYAGAGVGLVFDDRNSEGFSFRFNGSDKLRLDTNGNLGLGVTPSAWPGQSAAYYVSQFGNAAFYGISTNEARMTANAYVDAGGTNRYISNGYATRHDQKDGVYTWRTAASGTAGNAITFTQAMTLDASGNLGVGTTSPTGISNYGAMTINGTNGGLLDLKYGNTLSGRLVASTGSVGIECSSTNYLYFYLNGSERARIDSSGNLLVGQSSTTTPGLSNTTDGFSVRSLGDGFFSASGTTALYANRNTNDGSVVSLRRGGTEVGTISVTGSATAYNTSSDYRLKDNQQPLTGSGAFIDALQPKTWNWKADGSRGVGFIAHEVQEVSPGSVVGEKDGEQMQAMEYGSAEFIANIIAELQSLRKRLADAGIA